jgi:hypothetical protein
LLGAKRELTPSRHEGLSHAQYTINPDAPETREAFEEIARFFDRHMQR